MGHPTIQCLGEKVYAAYVDRRFLFGQEPYLAVSHNQGATWNDTDFRVNTEPPGYPEADYSEAFVSASSDGYVWVLYPTNQGSLSVPYARSSPDGGASWPNPQTAIFSALDRRAEAFQIRSMDGGRGFAFWVDDRGGFTDRGVYLRRSVDGGKTWLTDQMVNLNDTGGNSSDGKEYSTEPATCTDGKKKIYAVWKDKRNLNPSLFTRMPGRIALRYSSNAGANFLPAPGAGAKEIRLDVADTGKETESQLPAIGCSGENDVAVAWEDARLGPPEAPVWNVFLNYSKDGGANWLSQEVRINPPTLEGEAKRPRVVVLGGDPPTIAVTWERVLKGRRDLYVSASRDRGQTWSMPYWLNQEANSLQAEDWDFSGDGSTLVVVWAENLGNSSQPYRDIYSSRSDDYGQTWSPPRRIDLGTPPGSTDTPTVKVGSAGDSFTAIFPDFRSHPSKAETYSSGDGLPLDPNDFDRDGTPNEFDNCPNFKATNQQDRDSDGLGDSCDPYPDDPINDPDFDGYPSPTDNCPFLGNKAQDDTDNDGWGNGCDLCTAIQDRVQRDLDRDNLGDSCDDDMDGDGLPNTTDPDDDNDTVPDVSDNCPTVPNFLQADFNKNGIGDDCDLDDLAIQQVKVKKSKRMEWEKEPPAVSYNVQFGPVSRLSASKAYCYAPGLKFYGIELVKTDPPPGEAYWYTITAVATDGKEGSPGLTSAGANRPMPPVCDLATAGDWDADGVLNAADICPFDANPDQKDFDQDGLGDPCDPFPRDPGNDNLDHDRVGTDLDNCPFVFNPDQLDTDHDGLGDACDPCPANPDRTNLDTNRNGIPDACDPDIDGDQLDNSIDPDDDGDGVPDETDNCPTTPNGRQLDQDHDGTGDACDFNDKEVNGVTFNQAKTRLEWLREDGADYYSVYSDWVANLAPDSAVGQCLVGKTAIPFLEISAVVPPGQARFYLVTGWFGGAEGSAGADSAGKPRIVPTGCP